MKNALFISIRMKKRQHVLLMCLYSTKIKCETNRYLIVIDLQAIYLLVHT
jgi:hypothetical protein